MLKSTDNVRNIITDDQLYASFKNIQGTQYYHNMLLDVLAKVRKYVPYTFFLTCYAAEFKLVAIMQVLARQYGKQL